VLNKLLPIVIATAPGEGEKGKGGEGVRVARAARGQKFRVFTESVKMCFFKGPTASVENTANN
jgi:hypothetical protein